MVGLGDTNGDIVIIIEGVPANRIRPTQSTRLFKLFKQSAVTPPTASHHSFSTPRTSEAPRAWCRTLPAATDAYSFRSTKPDKVYTKHSPFALLTFL